MASKSKLPGKWNCLIVLLFLLFSLLSFLVIVPPVSAAAINSTTVDGLLVYSEGTEKFQSYRLWNDSIKNFTSKQNDNATKNTSITIDWFDVQANHERDEFIAVFQDDNRNHYVKVYNNSAATWGNALALDATGADNIAFISIAVAYEDISGNALIVYENGGLNNADNKFGYRIWNGTGYSAETNETINENDEIHEPYLYSKAGTNQIMLLHRTEGGNISTMLWDGTTFVNKTFIQNFTGKSWASNHPFWFSWEGSSGDGIVVYQNATTSLSSIEFNATTGAYSANLSFNLSSGAVESLKTCSDPSSNYIISLSADNVDRVVDVNVWNGSAWYTEGQPSKATIFPTGQAWDLSCAWRSSGQIALLTYPTTLTPNRLNTSYYTNFSRNPDRWETKSLVANRTDILTDTNSVYRSLIANPVTNEIMFILKEAQAATGKSNVHLWNSTQWQNITELSTYISTSMCNQGYKCIAFDWSRYDPNPNVSGLAVNTSALNNLNENINITVNVTDNLNIDTVSVNITKPDSIITQANLTNVGQVFNLTFSSTDVRGTYTILVIANDTSKHQNINATETLTFTAGDITAPAVTNLAVNASAPGQNEVVNISVNVTDATNVDVVLVNITIPTLGAFDQYKITNISGALPKTFNLTFANTSRVGTYTVRIIANDTFNNINDTQTITFAVGDTTRPVVTQLAVNQTSLFPGQTLNFTVNVTDNVAVDVVLVNVTVPGLSVFDQYRMTNISGALPATFNLTFANTSRVGTYMIRVIANDTVNNINSTQTINFSVGDVTTPTIALNAPVDVFNTSNPNITFQFTPTDDMNTTVFANITVDSVVNVTNSSAVNNTLTTLQGIGFAEGNHSWNVTASDGTGNQNTSTTRRFVVDQSITNFHSLTNEPSSAGDVDPGVRLAFFGHVSDNFTAPHVVYLQHKLSTDADFTNVTATYNSSNNRYEASFTPGTAGTYTTRLFANDTVNNRGTSTETNISVQNDNTWTRSPTSVAVGAAAAENKSFVNITITNTGDTAKNFTITSTFQNTTFNTTFPLQLAANEARIVEVNVTSPRTTGGYSFQLEINATPNGDPANSNVSATLAVTEGQPFLAATITTIPASATKGTSISITGQVQNIGTGNASNGTYFFTVPSDWNQTGGNLNTTFTELLVNDKLTATINFEIPSTANDGLQTVMINATGVNQSGADLVPLNLTSGDAQIINISNASSGNLGGQVENTGGAPGGATGGGAGGAGAPISYIGQTKLRKSSAASELRSDSPGKAIETEETMYVVRGEVTQFPLTIRNIYNNSAMTKVRLSVEGELAKYVSWEPENLTNIAFNESKQFFVNISTPGYKEREELDITFIITGTVVAKYIDFEIDPTTGFEDTIVTQIKTEAVERRVVRLIIIETTQEEAKRKVEYAQQVHAAFEENRLKTAKLGALVAEIEAAYAQEEYATVDRLYNRIKAQGTAALEAQTILGESKARYDEAIRIGYNTGELNVLITLADRALEREDFESALLRAKETQLYELIVVEQQFDISAFLLSHWKLLLLFAAATGIIGVFVQKKIFLLTVNRRIALLLEEEKKLEHLKEEAQDLCFVKKQISNSAYHKRMTLYEARNDAIRKTLDELFVRKQELLSKKDLLTIFAQEHAELANKLKKVQTAYFIENKMPRKEFLAVFRRYREQLTHNDEEVSILTALYDEEMSHLHQIKQHLQETKLRAVIKAVFHKNIHPLLIYSTDMMTALSFKLRQVLRMEKFPLLFTHPIQRKSLTLPFVLLIALFGSLLLLPSSMNDGVTGYATAQVLTQEEVNLEISEAKEMRSRLEAQGIGTKTVDNLLQQMETARMRQDYWEADRLANRIESLGKTALESQTTIAAMKERYKHAKYLGYNTGQMEGLITLAERALEREDFSSALLRAKETEIYALVVVEQQFDLSAFLRLHWWKVLLLLAFLGMSGTIAQRKLFLMTIDKRLARLEREELDLETRKEKAQDLCFVKKLISRLDYHKQMHLYEGRLELIRKKIDEMTLRKQEIVSKEDMAQLFGKEYSKVLERIKQLQKSYFIENKMPQKDFERFSRIYKDQLTSNEEKHHMLKLLSDREQFKLQELRERIKKGHISKLLKDLVHKKSAPIVHYIADLLAYGNVFFQKKFHVERLFVFHSHLKKLAVPLVLLIVFVGSLVLSEVFLQQEDATSFTGLSGYAIGIKHMEQPTEAQLEKDRIATEKNRAALEEKRQSRKNVTSTCIIEIPPEKKMELDKNITLLLEGAAEDIRTMQTTGLRTMYVEELYNDMVEEALEQQIDYKEIEADSMLIHNAREVAVYVQDLLMLKKEELVEFDELLTLNISEAWMLYDKAETELMNERYDLAEESADAITPTLNRLQMEATRLTTVIKAQKNRFVEWVVNNILWLLIILILLSITTFVVYRKGKVIYLERKRENLSLQKNVLLGLIRNVQWRFFINKEMSESFFSLKLKKYKEDIEKIKIALSIAEEDLEKAMRKRIFHAGEKDAVLSLLLFSMVFFGIFVGIFFAFGTSDMAESVHDNALTGFVIYGGGLLQHLNEPTETQLEADKNITEKNKATRAAKRKEAEEQEQAPCPVEERYTQQEILTLLTKAEENIQLIADAGLQTLYVEDLYEQMRDEASEEYADDEKIREKEKLIAEAKEDALYLADVLELKQEEIREFEEILDLNVSEAWTLYARAEKELENEHYKNAEETVNEITPTLNYLQVESTRVTTLLKAQRNRFMEWLVDNLSWIILVVIILGISGYYAYKEGEVFYLKKKIQKILLQQKALHDLLIRTQNSYFVDKKISENLFALKVARYKEDLEKLKTLLSITQEDFQQKLASGKRKFFIRGNA